MAAPTLTLLSPFSATPTVATLTPCIGRYEARHERAFHRALKELQRIQKERKRNPESPNGFVSQNEMAPLPEVSAPRETPHLAPMIPIKNDLTSPEPASRAQ